MDTIYKKSVFGLVPKKATSEWMKWDDMQSAKGKVWRIVKTRIFILIWKFLIES